MNNQESLTDPNSHLNQGTTRRHFFGRLIGLIAGLITATLALPLASYTILPAFRKRAKDWVDIVTTEQLRINEPESIQVVSTLKDGWLETISTKSVWTVRKKDDEVVVYSPLCTHLGCGYRWEADRQLFFCPCHASMFDIDGRVLAGPAPRPLDTLPTKIEKGHLWIIYKEYKAGTPKKIEI
jgi:menaquinol-cytochrome c reductase iron-sulfur subunit